MIIEGDKNKVENYIRPEINFLPANLELDKVFGGKKLFVNFNKDCCVKLLSTLSTRTLYNKELRDNAKVDGTTYFSLSSELLEKYVRNYKSYIDLFKDSGVWDSKESYIVGTKCKGYRYTATYSTQPCKSYYNYKYGVVQSDSNKKTISSTIDKCKKYSPTVNKLIDYLDFIEIDYNSAKEHIEHQFSNGIIEVGQYNNSSFAIEKMWNKEFFANQDERGRLYTNITNFKTGLKKFLKVDGQALVSLDLKNSQPFFSTLILNSEFWEDSGSMTNKITFNDISFNINQLINIPSIIMFLKFAEHNDDVLLYRDCVIGGYLYEYFQEELLSNGFKCETRADAKTRIFQIFFSEERHLANSKFAIIFKSIFPTVFELFMLIKKSEYNTLALLLQSIESQIFLEGIARNFIENNPNVPIFTIHDSILAPMTRANGLDIEMSNYIEEMTGCKPSIEVDILN